MKDRKVLKISSFVFTMVMLVLFSVGTIMTDLPRNVHGNDEQAMIQKRTSGGPIVELKKFNVSPSATITGNGYNLGLEIEASSEAIYGDTNEIMYYALWAKNQATGEVIYASTGFSENNSSVKITSASPGTYRVSGLTAFVKVSSAAGAPLEPYYMSAEECSMETECSNQKLLQKVFTIPDYNDEEVSAFEYSVSFVQQSPSVSVGDKLDLMIRRADLFDEVMIDRKDLESMMLSYTNSSDGSVLNAYVKSVNCFPYIIVPSTATPGTYQIDYAYLTFTDGTSLRYKNTATKSFSYNISFTVKEQSLVTSKYAFSNEMYDAGISKDLDKLDSDAIITIDANRKPLIESSIFEKIANTKRTLFIDYGSSQWVFSGVDIKNPKDIDVSTLVSNLESNSEYYNSFIKTNITSPSAMLKFSDNGDLPGKVLIRIDSSSIDSYLMNPNKVFVYYYKEDDDQLFKVAMEIQSNNGYYEFYVNHNSKYIVTSKEVVTDVVSSDLGMLSLNNQVVYSNKSQSSFILYVLATSCGVLAILLLITLSVKSSKTKQVQS